MTDNTREEIADLVRAFEQLLVTLEVDGPATADEPDDEPVGTYGDGKPLPMTFVHVRNARAAIKAAKELLAND